MAFWAIKTRSSKSQKIAIFLKGLPNGFGPKMAVFVTSFFFGQYRLGKCVLRYSRMKNAFVGFKKGSSKSRKIAIFANGKKREPMVLVQK